MRLLLSLCCLIALSGCTVASYTEAHADGTKRSVLLIRGGYDTKVGLIDGQIKPDGSSIRVENLDSQAKAVDLAIQALQAVKATPHP